MRRTLRAGLLAASALVLPLAPAHAGWLDDVMAIFGSGGNGMASNGAGRSEIEAERAAGAAVAGDVGYLPALLGTQILQETEAHIQTDLQWRMLEALEGDTSSRATAASETVRRELGGQGIEYD